MALTLFKSADDRRMDRDIKIRQGIRRIERAVKEQGKFSDELIGNARQAKEIGDKSQYNFIRGMLKKSMAFRNTLERQLLVIKNALILKQQAESGLNFVQSMSLISSEITRLYSETDLTKTQAAWEKAMTQSGSMGEKTEIFLDGMESMAAEDTTEIDDAEIDALIETKERAECQRELIKMELARTEIAALKKPCLKGS